MGLKEVLTTIAVGIIVFIAGFLVRLAQKKGDSSVKEVAVSYSLDIVAKLAASAVGRLEQQYGKDIRKKILAGEATRENLCQLAGFAFNEVMKKLKYDTYCKLEEGIDDLNSYIENVIETEVIKLKNQLAATSDLYK